MFLIHLALFPSLVFGVQKKHARRGKVLYPTFTQSSPNETNQMYCVDCLNSFPLSKLRLNYMYKNQAQDLLAVHGYTTAASNEVRQTMSY